MNPPGWTELEAAYRAACRLLAEPPGPVHLLGIGGVGMAALAVHLQGRGHVVSGCDAQLTRITKHLESVGIRIWPGHAPNHLGGNEQLVVRSPAVHESEPELAAARAADIPIFTRGVVLPALLRSRSSAAIAGSHGKTTTTAMVAHILRTCARPMGFAVGGEIDETGAVAEYSATGPIVVEADESDGTLALYEAEHAIITNVELDHVDFFHSDEALYACFRRFVARTRGSVWYCADDAGAVRVAARHPHAHSFGFGAGSELRAHSIRESGLKITAAVEYAGKPLGDLTLAVPGRTNLIDALGALGLATELGIPFEEAVAALASFRAVRRRFEIVARAKNRVVVSDYAHHPTEIRALLGQARKLGGRRLIAVYQPHRYTRTAALAAEFPPAFAGLDELVLAPVYAASETPVPGGTSADLLPHFQSGLPPVTLAHSLLEAWELIRNKWREGDVLLVIGAGDVEKIAAWAAVDLSGPTSSAVSTNG